MQNLVNASPSSFSLTGGVSAQGSVVGSVDCNTDWITIPCATNTNFPNAQSGTPSVCVDRICGMVFNSVTTASGTSSVPVNSRSHCTITNLFKTCEILIFDAILQCTSLRYDKNWSAFKIKSSSSFFYVCMIFMNHTVVTRIGNLDINIVPPCNRV